MALSQRPAKSIVGIADECRDLLTIDNRAQRTREFVARYGSRLGLKAADADTLVARHPAGVPRLMAGGSHENVLVASAWGDFLVRTDVRQVGTGPPRRWDEAEALKVLGKELARTDAEEAAAAEARGEQPLHVLLPELLYADAAGRQVHRFFPGEKLRVPEQLPLVVEAIARFAQVRRTPRAPESAPKYTTASAGAHERIARSDRWLDANREKLAARYQRLGLPLYLDELHELADAFQDRPPVVLHGDLNPGNVLVRGRDVRALDIELAEPGDWVHDLAWTMATVGTGDGVPPELVDHGVERMRRIDPRLAPEGTKEDLEAAYLIAANVHGPARLHIGLLRIHEGKVTHRNGIEGHVQEVVERSTPLLDYVRRRLGDGGTVEAADVEAMLWEAAHEAEPTRAAAARQPNPQQQAPRHQSAQQQDPPTKAAQQASGKQPSPACSAGLSPMDPGTTSARPPTTGPPSDPVQDVGPAIHRNPEARPSRQPRLGPF
ncbi:hypothetical protein GCM10023205_77510 [Yinghuangia aomiensis]|uniref:Aminoglycoside phosphotransferase domain-containing protein n=1 Tax=Yinghuangia aomiensis TaxID=676205 RepID=A0ABP9IBI2_9ACTN